MTYEVETKILGIDAEVVAKRLADLGARKILDTRYSVDWYRTVGVREGEDLWFLRVRTASSGASQITWKGLSEVSEGSVKHKEININIDDPIIFRDLFLSIGLEKYAHQEKDRISWILDDWRFDLDTYPGMPAYLEIEGPDENSITEAVTRVGLSGHKRNATGERKLIQQEYGLDWYSMYFAKQ